MERSEQQAECCCRLLQSFDFACCCWKLEVLEVVQRRGVLGSRRGGRLLRDVPVTQHWMQLKHAVYFRSYTLCLHCALSAAVRRRRLFWLLQQLLLFLCHGSRHDPPCVPWEISAFFTLSPSQRCGRVCAEGTGCPVCFGLEWGECGRGAAGGCGPHVSPHPSSQDREWRSFAPLWIIIFSWNVR